GLVERFRHPPHPPHQGGSRCGCRGGDWRPDGVLLGGGAVARARGGWPGGRDSRCVQNREEGMKAFIAGLTLGALLIGGPARAQELTLLTTVVRAVNVPMLV